MVLKLTRKINSCVFWFESDVISDGTQTHIKRSIITNRFESDVISDGTQTNNNPSPHTVTFESDVISDGTQTYKENKFLRILV